MRDHIVKSGNMLKSNKSLDKNNSEFARKQERALMQRLMEVRKAKQAIATAATSAQIPV